ncbi:helix-turn-helix domain-containing protein, partial [Streptomyces sp. YS-3]|uniref:helix-turn-helix domain-containing protein n=1 Tax=Streptomyces sp. YS-3 TaxID=3381352 RepID=UPI00386244DD
MGRREKAVTADTRQSAALARWLREQRKRCGLTYAAMAFRIDNDVTASALSRAASGNSVPSLRVIEAYAAACDADVGEARRLWKSARHAEQRRRLRDTSSADDLQDRDLADKLDRVMTPHPEVIDTFAQLRRAMVQLRASEGQPSLEELQRRAGPAPGGGHLLPKSSLNAILRGQAVPLRRHITALTRALGASEWRVAEWERAWDRITGQRPIPARPTWL